MTWLKQSTAGDVALGPFVDATDGVTPETGLSLTQAECRLKKNGGAWAQKNQASTAAHEEEGWYEVNLDATDTNTLGILVLAVYVSGALPAWRGCLVVPAHGRHRGGHPGPAGADAGGAGRRAHRRARRLGRGRGADGGEVRGRRPGR